MRAAVAIALFFAAVPSAPVLAQSPALWSVSDADTTIYLFGSVHAFDNGPTWLSGDIRAAYDAADEVVLEAVISDPAKASAIAEKLGRSDLRLRSVLPKADTVRLEAMLATAEAKRSALDPFKPWYANMVVTILALSGTSLNRDMAVEAVLQDRAARDGKKLIGLETVEQQFAMFDGMPVAAQVEQLSKTLNNPARARANTESTAKCWRVGDLGCVAAAAEREYGDIPDVRQSLLVRRNERWAAWIVDRLKQPGAVFVAVGIDHFVGEGNVIDQLAAHGTPAKRIGSVEVDHGLAAASAER